MTMQLSTTDWLTLALVLITGFYAWATFKILRANEGVVAAMREQTEAQLRPYVVVAVVPRIGTTLLLLEVQNTGRSPALGLRLSMDRDFYPHAERREQENIARLPAFTEVVDSLAPGVRLQFVLGVGGTIFAPGVDEDVCPKVFCVRAEYEYGGKTYAEDNKIDLRPMLHSAAIQDPVAEEIKEVRKVLEKMPSR